MKSCFRYCVFFLCLCSYQVLAAQEIPDLADWMVLCPDGAIPHYRSCEDEPCQTEYRDSSGQLRAKGNCSEGVKTGEWTTYYPNGQMRSKGYLQHGQPEGFWIFYHANGNKMARGRFSEGQFERGCAGSGSFQMVAVKEDQWTFWYANGQLQIKCHFESNLYGQERLEGRYTSYFDNGQKASEGTYKDGSLTDTWTYWYANGKKKAQAHYSYQDCGLYDYTSYECPNGTWLWWDEAGRLTRKVVYQNGQVLKEEQF